MIESQSVPVIGEEADFYGYIVGLSVGLGDPCPGYLDRHLYVMFEYNGKRKVWIVPDEELFKILSGYLCETAWLRKNSDDYGYNKLWIEKKDGKWIVDLP